jgi:hypothetical protein
MQPNTEFDTYLFTSCLQRQKSGWSVTAALGLANPNISRMR